MGSFIRLSKEDLAEKIKALMMIYLDWDHCKLDQIEEDIRILVNELEAKSTECNYRIAIKNGNKLVYINSSDIVYIEKRARKLEIVTTNLRYCIGGTLKEIEQRLPPVNFFKCCKGIIINISYVDEISNDTICLYEGKYKIGMSTRKIKYFKDYIYSLKLL